MSCHDRGDGARAPCRRLSPRPKAERRTTKPPLNHPAKFVATKPSPHYFPTLVVSAHCVFRPPSGWSGETPQGLIRLRGFSPGRPQGCFLTAASAKAMFIDICFVVLQSVNALLRTVVKASLGTSFRASMWASARTSGGTSVRAFVRTPVRTLQQFDVCLVSLREGCGPHRTEHTMAQGSAAQRLPNDPRRSDTFSWCGS